MNRDVCNGFLEALALLNDGTNHGSEYTLEQLPEAASLAESLAAHFASLSADATPPQPASAWNIQVEAMQSDWPLELAPVLREWFFAQEFSPSVDPDVASGLVAQFMEHLRASVVDATAHRVRVSPPVWYECWWQDTAFESQGARWLLHLGFSD